LEEPTYVPSLRFSPEDGDGDGFAGCDGDCDDTNPAWFPADEGSQTTVSEMDSNADGTIDTRARMVVTTNPAGDSLSTILEEDTDLDGGWDLLVITFTNTYDDDGNTLSHLTTSETFIFLSEYTYDTDGNRVLTTYTFDSDADGVWDSITHATESYDSAGNRVSMTEEYDSDNDGTVDTTKYYTYTYSSEGHLEHAENDIDGDGTLDNVFEYHTEVDADGNVLVWSQTSDNGADGVINYATTRTYSYDDDGRLLTELEERDQDGDGDLDWIVNEQYIYDTVGNLLTYNQQQDANANGSADYETSNTYTYDSDDNLLTEHKVRIEQGVTDYSEETVHIYVDGMLTQTTYERDDSDDGSIEHSKLWTYTYDEYGNMLEAVLEDDTDGDGAWNSIQTGTYTGTWACPI
jgi:hypothetical protein